MIVVGSVLSLMGEVLLRVSLGFRDRILYRCLFKSAVGAHRDPLALQRLPRNQHLRINNRMYETMSEFVCIWNACALVIIWDIDNSGGQLSRHDRVIGALTSAAIQTCFEWGADFISCTLLRSWFGTDVIAGARGRKWYWALPTCFCFVVCSTVASDKVLKLHLQAASA